MHYVCTEKREGSKLIAKIVVKMIQKLHFVKMHGAGTDYIYVDAMEYDMDDPAAVARMVSDRHKGIGSDGLVLIGRAEDLDRDRADFTMRIFNADGSEARMCGNACRCVGKYLYERQYTRQTDIRLQTLSGVKLLELHVSPLGTVETVCVDMGEPQFENRQQYIPDNDPHRQGTFVSMGNPHYVIFTDQQDEAFVSTAATSNSLLSAATAYASAYGNAVAASPWLAGPEPAPPQWRQPLPVVADGEAASSWTEVRWRLNGDSPIITYS